MGSTATDSISIVNEQQQNLYKKLLASCSTDEKKMLFRRIVNLAEVTQFLIATKHLDPQVE
ncbi:MAG TPA: hypothetical protein VGJ93_12650 [Desulfuromonadaceae bacterium]|jgi:flagellar motor switch protein FliG